MMGHQIEPSRSGRSRWFSHTRLPPLCPGQFAFARDALMLFARTLDAIFELMVIVGKELGLGHVVEPAGHIAIDRREQHGVADLDVWHSKELSFAVGCRDLLHGQVIGDVLAVACLSKGRTMILTMNINPDGSLSGKWSRRTDRGTQGTETWTKT